MHLHILRELEFDSVTLLMVLVSAVGLHDHANLNFPMFFLGIPQIEKILLMIQ
jgi:hypothetical protein